MRRMPKAKKSLHSILGLTSPSGVKKPSKPSTSRSPHASPSKRKSSASKAGLQDDTGADDDPAEEEEEDYFQDHLDDHGLVRALVTDLHLSDVVQAMRFIRGRMWTPMPDRRTGMASARVSEVLNYRLAMPPLVTVAHLQAVLMASPSRVEREVARLVEKGIVKRVVVKGRSEAVVEVGDLMDMAGRAGVDEGTRAAYERFVKGGVGADELDREQVDVLVKAGFLTSSAVDAGGAMRGGRPAGLLGTTRTLEHLAMAPAGSLDAVGGSAAQMVTGSGTPSSSSSSSRRANETLSISVPNNGAFIKLLKAALDHLSRLLEQRSAFREMPEDALREAWDGGLGERRRGGAGFSGVLPGRTRKWKEHWGLRFEWVLEEAVGAGVVEVFETGSVGRGVRGL